MQPLENLPSADHLRSLHRLEGRTALITGGASGLGLAMAWGLACLGADIAIVDRDVKAAFASAKAIADGSGQNVQAYGGDVSIEWDVLRLTQQIIETFGRIDILINNAGYNVRKPLLDYTVAEFDNLYAVHVRGAFLFCRAIGNHMREHRSGTIINIASILALVGAVNAAPYAAAKAGIQQLTRAFALEMAAHGVRVNAIAPGYIDSAITQRHDQDLRDRVNKLTPLGRYGKPSELIGPALFLASDASSFVTGTTVTVDGGWTVQ